MSFKELSIHHEYFPHSQADPEAFFRDAVGAAVFYRRAAGYFSSSVFQLFNEEVLDFARRGGRIQLVCSNQLAEQDVGLILSNNSELDPDDNVRKQVAQLLTEKSASEPLAFFATLLKFGILKIKIARGPGGGIFHDKTGYFEDASGNAISFRGSANETFMGWSRQGNFETLEAFCSWRDEDKRRVENHANYLRNLWDNTQQGLTVVELSTDTLQQITQCSRADIDAFEPVFENLKKVDHTKADRPSVSAKPLFDFQHETLKNWELENFHGIVKHATGTGKTVTAIEAIRRHIRDGSAAVVLVPSILLLDQWRDELRKEIPGVVVQVCGGKHVSWKRPGRIAKILHSRDGRDGAVILATMDTASSNEFIGKLTGCKDALLVADEVHNLGSPKKRAILECEFGKRLGLSATPERYRDPDGTAAIFEYFKGILRPEINIQDAIRMGRLVEYLYYPTPVFLDAEETDEYNKITKQITRSWIKEDAGVRPSELTKKLLIKRARVAKKASAKVVSAVGIISKNYAAGQYWLIYCEDSEQLNQVDVRLRQIGINAHIYTTTMVGSKSAELQDYTSRGGVMLSIGCLDEGVDIPKISHAVILASSQNPRQFIQRRGRVLRKDGVKLRAEIYDLFTFPSAGSEWQADGLLKAELRRALEFSSFAMNYLTAMAEVRRVFVQAGLPLEEYLSEIESDGEEEGGEE